MTDSLLQGLPILAAVFGTVPLGLLLVVVLAILSYRSERRSR